MALPQIPRLEKFCFCLEVHSGVFYFSVGLMLLWILYAIGAIVQSVTGFIAWSILWCAVSIACYGCAIYGIRKKNKNFLLPALFMSMVNVVLGIIDAVVALVYMWILSAVVVLVIAAISAYYFVGLKNVYDDFGGVASDNPV